MRQLMTALVLLCEMTFETKDIVRTQQWANDKMNLVLQQAFVSFGSSISIM